MFVTDIDTTSMYVTPSTISEGLAQIIEHSLVAHFLRTSIPVLSVKKNRGLGQVFDTERPPAVATVVLQL